MRFLTPSILVMLVALSLALNALGTPLRTELEFARALLLGVSAIWLLILVFSENRRADAGLLSKKATDTTMDPVPSTKLQTEDLTKANEEKKVDDQLPALIAQLQQRGRFFDFLMDDITPYNDQQVGAAARVVHQGCSAVMREFFTVNPIFEGPEGSKITLAKEFDPLQFRLIGKVLGDPPYHGRVIHRGWKSRELIIAPAEVEVGMDSNFIN